MIAGVDFAATTADAVSAEFTEQFHIYSLNSNNVQEA